MGDGARPRQSTDYTPLNTDGSFFDDTPGGFGTYLPIPRSYPLTGQVSTFTKERRMLQEQYEQQRLLAEQADMQLQYGSKRREQQQREIRDTLRSKKRDKDGIQEVSSTQRVWTSKRKIFVELNSELKTSVE